MEEELALNDADPSNAVSKKCKHGVKTLVDTIVDQPCQYGNVVIMSYGGYYDAYPVWSLCYRRSNNSTYIAKRRTSTYLNIAMLARRLAMSQVLYMGIHISIKDIKEIDKMCKSRKAPKQTGLDKMLIKIADRKGNSLVDARELHKVLQIGSNFTTWFYSMVDYGFVEGKDFVELIPKKEKNIYGDFRGRPQKNFAITTRMAEHICLVQKNEIGMKCRQFLLDVNELFFQMMLRSNDKAFQKEAMARLKKLIPNYEQKKLEGETIIDFATSNKVVNKVVSDYYGLHYCNKSAMPKEMIETRDKIMDEYIILYKYCDSTEEIESKLRKAYPKSDTPKAKSNYNRPIKDISTGRVYPNAGIASKSTGLPKDKIVKNCNGDIEKVNKEHKFIYND